MTIIQLDFAESMTRGMDKRAIYLHVHSLNGREVLPGFSQCKIYVYTIEGDLKEESNTVPR